MPNSPNDLSTTASSAAEHALRISALEPINSPLLSRLGEIADGSLVLDMACGIGEPTLAVARRYPGARVLGIDVHEAALEAARGRAAEGGLGNVDFRAMSFEDLDLPTASVDAVLSRLGVLLFGDPVAGTREMARVLSPGAPFSLALWSDPDDNPYMRFGRQTLTRVISPDQVPATPSRFTPLASSKNVESWLTEAGMSTVHSTLLHWDTPFTDFDTWWGYNSSAGPLNTLFADLDSEARHAARAHMKQLLDESRTPSGGYEIESRCRFVWGTR
ncbi:class I SAM-dependent methyltransferase [Streptomyces sp. NPDC087856]|uniref:class I SAM-dependent methyltransferase n=1 Tax=Streptomyces sp. NPDC087856 TaxID=3365811 RepID=UPI00380C3F27